MAEVPSPAQPDFKECLEEADKLKAEGNSCFKAGEWPEAIAAYRAALDKLPKRTPESQDDVEPGLGQDDDNEGSHEPVSESTPNPSSIGDGDQRSQSTSSGPSDGKLSLSPQEEACAKARAVLNANIGACYVKQADHKQAVEACTEALKDDPKYQKALQRRASSNETLNTWTSLTSAQEDYNTLLQLCGASSPEGRNATKSLAQLKPRLEAAQKRETDEMLGKLKDLGNSILGKFGLSTNNFQFTPNGQGGYSMNFQG